MCISLEEVRECINNVDDVIIELLTQRQMLVIKAAEFKKDETGVRDSGRVAAVLCRIKDKAVENGLNPIVAVNTYRAMIESFISIELTEFEEKNQNKTIEQRTSKGDSLGQPHLASSSVSPVALADQSPHVNKHHDLSQSESDGCSSDNDSGSCE